MITLTLRYLYMILPNQIATPVYDTLNKKQMPQYNATPLTKKKSNGKYICFNGILSVDFIYTLDPWSPIEVCFQLTSYKEVKMKYIKTKKI